MPTMYILYVHSIIVVLKCNMNVVIEDTIREDGDN